MAKKPLIPVTPSSGNVFADIGVPEPEEELAKAQLASRIREIVRRQSPHAGCCRCRDGHRSAQGVGLAEWPTDELLERTPDASPDQARAGRGDRRQVEAATTPARSHPRRCRGSNLKGRS